MGFFSWLTADTNQSIPSSYSSKPTIRVHMITEDGRVFTETNYEGYGVFGDKDFYTLAAELNGHKGKDDQETRKLFFDRIWKRGVRKDGKSLEYRIDFEHYEAPIQSEGGLTANQLVSEHGWEYWEVSRSGNTQDFVDAGFKMPKIVSTLLVSPTNKDEWKKFWDSMPYNKSCPDQGFFYPEDDEPEECIVCGGYLNDDGFCESCGE